MVTKEIRSKRTQIRASINYFSIYSFVLSRRSKFYISLSMTEDGIGEDAGANTFGKSRVPFRVKVAERVGHNSHLKPDPI